MKRQVVVSPATLALGAGLAVAVLVIAVMATVMLTGGGDSSVPAQSASPSATSTTAPTAVPSASLTPTTAATETPPPTATPLPPTPAATPTPVVIVVQATAAPLPPTPVPPTAALRDVVVGVVYGCTMANIAGASVLPPAPQGAGSTCEAAARLSPGYFWRDSVVHIGATTTWPTVYDIRLTLTVRTPSSSLYSVVIGGPSSVSIGDQWPPK